MYTTIFVHYTDCHGTLVCRYNNYCKAPYLNWASISGKRMGASCRKNSLKTSVMAYNAWLQVVSIHSLWCDEAYKRKDWGLYLKSTNVHDWGVYLQNYLKYVIIKVLKTIKLALGYNFLFLDVYEIYMLCREKSVSDSYSIRYFKY